MEKLNRSLLYNKFKQSFPEKVLMFGEGARARAFACLAFDELIKKGFLNGSVTVVQPGEEGNIELLSKQDGLFNIIERGVEGGKKTERKKLITCVENYVSPYDNYNNYIRKAKNPELRFIVSDTAADEFAYKAEERLGDKPQSTFPAKLTAFLYERFMQFNGDRYKGLILLPCELIAYNGDRLHDLVEKYASQWELTEAFMKWVDFSCIFANTLADKIVTGYPRIEADKICEELGYRDDLLNVSELFYFWAIENKHRIKEELPFEKAGLNVVFVGDVTPYYLRKIHMLEAAHILTAPAALLSGYTTIGEAAGDSDFYKYLEQALFTEIIPTLDTNKNVLDAFARLVLERFLNTYIKHDLNEITFNCLAKFKKSVLPTILEYQKRYGNLPPVLIFSFAAMIAFYKNGGRCRINDDEKNIAFLRDNNIDTIFKNTGVWEMDLAGNVRLMAAVKESFLRIKAIDVKAEISRIIN